MERVFTYRGRLVRETPKAYLADLEAAREQVWLPKSEVEYDDGSEFVIPEWLVNEKDLPKPRSSW